MININREVSSLIWTHGNTSKFTPRERERQVRWEEEEEEEAAEDILSLGFLSLSDIVLSDESIQKKLLGFLPFGFPRIKSMCLYLSDPSTLD